MKLTHPSPQNEPYDYKYYIIISRVYRLSAEEAAELQASSPRTKRQKQSEPPTAAGVYPFHPEDDYIRKVGRIPFSGVCRDVDCIASIVCVAHAGLHLHPRAASRY